MKLKQITGTNLEILFWVYNYNISTFSYLHFARQKVKQEDYLFVSKKEDFSFAVGAEQGLVSLRRLR
jgi:hypothetical protein